jgi:hypothetical protein
VRSTAAISDPATAKDMRQFARAEFERHRNVTDLVSYPLDAHQHTMLTIRKDHIRYLISVCHGLTSDSPHLC